MVKAHLLLKILSLEVITFVSSQTLLAEIQSYGHMLVGQFSVTVLYQGRRSTNFGERFTLCVNTDHLSILCLAPSCTAAILNPHNPETHYVSWHILLPFAHGYLLLIFKNIAEKSFCVENHYRTLIFGLTTSLCILHFFVAIGSWKILINAIMYIIISKMSIFWQKII